MVLSASTLGVILKLMDTTESKGHPFEHPFFQCLIMFAGESLCIFIYLYQRYSLVRNYGSVQASPGMQNAVKEGMKTDINPLLFTIPMLCDSGASALLLIGYINLPASITQMMGGFVVFVVAIMSILFLKRKLYRHHWSGLALLFIGIGFVALSVLVAGKNQENPNENPIIGIPLMIISILIQGVQYIVEEKLLGSYYLDPMKVVGWEGITGCILW